MTFTLHLPTWNPMWSRLMLEYHTWIMFLLHYTNRIILQQFHVANAYIILIRKCNDSVREVRYQVVTNTNCMNLLFRDICGIDPLNLGTHIVTYSFKPASLNPKTTSCGLQPKETNCANTNEPSLTQSVYSLTFTFTFQSQNLKKNMISELLGLYYWPVRLISIKCPVRVFRGNDCITQITKWEYYFDLCLIWNILCQFDPAAPWAGLD